MVNKAIIIGRLSRDVEIRYTPAGNAVANFSVATNEKYKNKAGEKVETVEFHNVIAWNKLGEICGEWLRKGQLVYIEGKLQTSKWDKDGVTHYKTEIVAREMKMLGGSAKTDNTSQEPDDDDSIPF